MDSGGTLATEEDFGYSIWLADTFSEVLDRSRSDAPGVDPDAFAQVVVRSACTLLQARGGAGKTYTAQRVREALTARGVWNICVPAVGLARFANFRGWTTDQWIAVATQVATDGIVIEQNSGVIVVDGLNEVDQNTAERILESIGPFTATHPHISFLITDRLTRRVSETTYWKHATLGPVPDRVIRSIAKTDPTGSLGIPFYLRRYLDDTSPDVILAEAIAKYIPEGLISTAAEVAFKSYELRRRRTIDADLFKEKLGAEIWGEMLRNSFVSPVQLGAETDFHFEHHLLHDYLAGLHLASHPELWGSAAFDILTLKASSFDGLALALGELDDPVAAEDLVQRVYDWNFYAAAYMIEDDRAGDRLVSSWLYLALLGALAEKRFDVIVPTALRAEDALRVQQTPTAAQLLATANRAEAVEVLQAAEQGDAAPEWFNVWMDLFSRPAGAPANEADVYMIGQTTQVLGWGAANAVRRFQLSPDLEEALRLLLRSSDPTVQWRAAHALGPHASAANFEALTQLFMAEDSGSWVAYGVLRALFEQAREADASRRADLVERIVEVTSRALGVAEALRTEAMRCMDVSPLPVDWHRDVEPVLVLLWETADARGTAELAALAERLRKRKEDALAS